MAFKETITPILGLDADEPLSETLPEFMNMKFKEVHDNTLDNRQQISISSGKINTHLSDDFSKAVFATRAGGLVGTQKITVGWKPKYIRILAIVNNTKQQSDITWCQNNISSGTLVRADTGNLSLVSNGILVDIRPDGSNIFQASLVSIDADGFTINWGATAGTVGGTVSMNITAIRHGEVV